MLGLEWLDILGDVIANFRESRLIVISQSTRVVLQGDLDLCYGEVAL